MLLAAMRQRRRILVGGTGAAQLAALQRLSPSLVDHVLMLRQQIFKRQQRPEPADGRSNLYEPLPVGDVAGSFGHLTLRRSAYTRALGQHPARARLLFGMAAAALARRILR